ncbi:MAG: hypothetical protein N3E37_03885 [Candidatus Micrarchaeota archaeon]|nr:hypothetical protein [Candidatus Micrarchaeota archaeon]
MAEDNLEKDELIQLCEFNQQMFQKLKQELNRYVNEEGKVPLELRDEHFAEKFRRIITLSENANQENAIVLFERSELEKMSEEELKEHLAFMTHLNSQLFVFLGETVQLVKVNNNQIYIDINDLIKQIKNVDNQIIKLNEQIQNESDKQKKDSLEKELDRLLLHRRRRLLLHRRRLSHFERLVKDYLDFRNNYLIELNNRRPFFFNEIMNNQKALHRIMKLDQILLSDLPPIKREEDKKEELNKHALVDTQRSFELLEEIHRRSFRIQQKSNFVRNVTLFLTNFPGWVLTKLQKNRMSEQTFNKPDLEIIQGSPLDRKRVALGLGIPIGLAIIGVSANLTTYLGSPLLSAVVSGVGTGIAIKNALDLVGRWNVLRRTENEVYATNYEIGNATAELNGKKNLAKLGADIRTVDLYTCFEKILGQKNLESLQTYLRSNPNVITDYVKSVAERAVTLAAHEPEDISKLDEFMKYHVQAIAGLLTISKAQTFSGELFTTEEDAKLAGEMLYNEIEKASNRGKFFQFIKWLLGSVIGLVVGIFTFNKFNIVQDQQKLKVKEEIDTKVLPQHSVIDQGNVLIGKESMKVWNSEVEKLITYLENNKQNLVGKTFKEVVESANIANQEVKERLLESFDTGQKLKQETIQGFIGLGKQKDELGYSQLAYHLERVHAAKDILGMKDTDPVVKNVIDSFTDAKKDPNEISKWKSALNTLREKINSVTGNKYQVASLGDLRIPRNKLI